MKNLIEIEKNNKNCLNCGKKLVGKQRKFCSKKCTNKKWKERRSEYMKEWRQQNPEKIKKYAKEWGQQN